MKTATKLVWVKQSRDFWRSHCGRFDLWNCPANGYWIAVDWERGDSIRSSRGTCETWCELRVTEGR